MTLRFFLLSPFNGNMWALVGAKANKERKHFWPKLSTTFSLAKGIEIAVLSTHSFLRIATFKTACDRAARISNLERDHRLNIARFQFLLWNQGTLIVPGGQWWSRASNKKHFHSLFSIRSACCQWLLISTKPKQMIFVYLSNKRYSLANTTCLHFSLMLSVVCINMEIHAALKHFWSCQGCSHVTQFSHLRLLYSAPLILKSVLTWCIVIMGSKMTGWCYSKVKMNDNNTLGLYSVFLLKK